MTSKPLIRANWNHSRNGWPSEKQLRAVPLYNQSTGFMCLYASPRIVLHEADAFYAKPCNCALGVFFQESPEENKYLDPSTDVALS